MTQIRHTARPWEYTYSPYTSQDGKEIPAFEILGESGVKICDTNENQPRKEQQANARLIAAAPDMLDVLEVAVERLEISNYAGEEDEYIAQGKAAILRAKAGAS